jgi:hypothetical protein
MDGPGPEAPGLDLGAGYQAGGPAGVVEGLEQLGHTARLSGSAAVAQLAAAQLRQPGTDLLSPNTRTPFW